MSTAASDREGGAPVLPGASVPVRPELNGKAAHVAAVDAARTRLSQDLELLNSEVRAQVSTRAEETTWKLVGTGAAILSGIAVRKIVYAVWRALRKNDPPANPADRVTSWPEALGFALATGAGIGVGRMIAARGAAAGWERMTGSLPPGLQDVG